MKGFVWLLDASLGPALPQANLQPNICRDAHFIIILLLSMKIHPHIEGDSERARETHTVKPH